MSIAKPRGPLPARVYWRRRIVVLAVACALVFGVGRLLGGSGDPEGPVAQPAAATATSASPTVASAGPTTGAQPSDAPSATTAPSPDARERAGKQNRDRAGTSTAPREPLAVPTGPCPDSDVRVQPLLREDARAGGKVRLTMKLTTRTSPACNWEVSADSVVVRLSSGSDRIWSSQQCPKPIPTKDVVLRADKPIFVDMFWNGRRSDPDCSRTTAWAEPGYYHMATAALGAEPEDRQFRLRSPAPVTVTPSPTAEPKKSEREKREDRSRDGSGADRSGGEGGDREDGQT